MQSKVLKMVLRVIGIALVAVGGFNVAVELFRSWHLSESSHSAALSLMLPGRWLIVTFAGIVLWVVSSLFPRRSKHA